jgi:hypothetical protein
MGEKVKEQKRILRRDFVGFYVITQIEQAKPEAMSNASALACFAPSDDSL